MYILSLSWFTRPFVKKRHSNEHDHSDGHGAICHIEDRPACSASSNIYKIYDFTRRYLKAGGREFQQSLSRLKKRERGIWQRRFWEHQIRDDEDLQRHVDYIHYNPVKHGLVDAVENWPWSTYHRYVREGFYNHRVLKDYDGNFGEDFSGE